MSQTSDILDALRAAGIPMTTEQLAEQLPHVTRANISSLCSQLRKKEILVGGIDGGKLTFAIARGAQPFQLDTIDLDAATPDAEPVSDEADTEDAVPPAQSFSPPSLTVDQDEPSRRDEDALRAAANRLESMLINEKASARAELAKSEMPEKPEPAAARRTETLDGRLHARATLNDGRLSRELAAAVLARWPGEIPYDVQRLVNRAATLPL